MTIFQLRSTLAFWFHFNFQTTSTIYWPSIGWMDLLTPSIAYAAIILTFFSYFIYNLFLILRIRKSQVQTFSFEIPIRSCNFQNTPNFLMIGILWFSFSRHCVPIVIFQQLIQKRIEYTTSIIVKISLSLNLDIDSSG